MIRSACLVLVFAQTASADPLTARVGVDVGTDSFRNIPEAERELAVAPIVELAIPIVESGGAISKVELGLAGWVSTRTGPLAQQPGDLMGSNGWDEVDGAIRCIVSLRSAVSISGAYTASASPNGSTMRMHEASVGVAWNDHREGRWLGFAPAVLVAQEIAGTRTSLSRGTFLGVTSRPAFSLATSKRAAVEVAIPLEIDLSLDDYCDDSLGSDTIGAMSAGVALATTVPARFGTWSFSATTRAIHFGPRMAVRAGDSTVLTMTGTVAVNF